MEELISFIFEKVVEGLGCFFFWYWFGIVKGKGGSRDYVFEGFLWVFVFFKVYSEWILVFVFWFS